MPLSVLFYFIFFMDHFFLSFFLNNEIMNWMTRSIQYFNRNQNIFVSFVRLTKCNFYKAVFFPFLTEMIGIVKVFVGHPEYVHINLLYMTEF